MLRLVYATFAAAALLTTSASAQPFVYDARWFTGVRDNVFTIQDRQRARIDAIERRRLADERLKVAESRLQASQSAPVPATASPVQ